MSQATWTKFVGSIGASTLAKWFLYSNTYERFLGSAHDIDLAGDWTGDRGLGKGGYGMVALWTQDDEHGLRHDEVVIKQQRRRSAGKDPEEIIAGLQIEAVIQRDLQRHEVDVRGADMEFRAYTAGETTDTQLRSIIDRHVVRLRNYKINLDDPLARYYQIYCRYGTIGALMSRYKAFEQKFPEPFGKSIQECKFIVLDRGMLPLQGSILTC